MLVLIVLWVKFQTVIFETSKGVVDEIVKIQVLFEEPAQLVAISEKWLINGVTMLHVT